MNSIEISMAPHRFDEQLITAKDDNGYPTRTDYYWRGKLVFYIQMRWDANGWREWLKVTEYKEPS